MMKTVIREGTLTDVGRLARIRAAVWGTEHYWHDRIGMTLPPDAPRPIAHHRSLYPLLGMALG